jgi:hypothetical protein
MSCRRCPCSLLGSAESKSHKTYFRQAHIRRIRHTGIRRASAGEGPLSATHQDTVTHHKTAKALTHSIAPLSMRSFAKLFVELEPQYFDPNHSFARATALTHFKWIANVRNLSAALTDTSTCCCSPGRKASGASFVRQSHASRSHNTRFTLESQQISKCSELGQPETNGAQIPSYLVSVLLNYVQVYQYLV